MTLPRLAVKRPVAMLMCVLCLLVFGISSIFDMEMESTPEMNMPVFMVMTRYEDASPEEVDSLVTDVIESALSSVSEVESMTSRSSEGSSMTTLEFGYDVDMDEKYDDINEALQRVRLPDSADDPTIMEMSMDSSSIMTLSIATTDTSSNIYSYIEDTVVPEIERIDGVSEVEMRGGALRVNGEIVAFTVGEPVGMRQDTLVVHIEKAFSDIQGAYTMINQQFAIHEGKGFQYMNREDDVGEEGLRQAKLSYKPVFLIEKGVVRERGLL